MHSTQCRPHPNLNPPTDDARDVFDDPAGLFAASGICLSRALKKLYSCQAKGKRDRKRYQMTSAHKKHKKSINNHIKDHPDANASRAIIAHGITRRATSPPPPAGDVIATSPPPSSLRTRPIHPRICLVQSTRPACASARARSQNRAVIFSICTRPHTQHKLKRARARAH